MEYLYGDVLIPLTIIDDVHGSHVGVNLRKLMEPGQVF